MRRLILVLLVPLFVSACGADKVFAPEDQVQRAIYRSDEPPSITLYTMINNRSGEGGHAALLVNGSQRVLFDPAGSWKLASAPERHDVLYGMTPAALTHYIDYHARPTYHVVEQKKFVSPQVAELALRLVQENGAVPKAMCANSVSGILRELPGFENTSRTYFPARLSRNFAETQVGLQTRKYFDDVEDNSRPMKIVNVLPGTN